jgi:hypothetical protein
MKEAAFHAADGKARIEQFDDRDGTGERFEVGAASPVRDATVRFTPEEWLRKLIDGAQRGARTAAPTQRKLWLKLAEIALDNAGVRSTAGIKPTEGGKARSASGRKARGGR